VASADTQSTHPPCTTCSSITNQHHQETNVNTNRSGRRRSSLTTATATLAATGLLLAACGSDDDGNGDTPDATDAPTGSVDDGGTDTTAAPDTEGGAGGDGETIRLWLNGGDTPDELVEYAVAEFNELHPDVTVEFERQQWTGIVEKLTTALSSSDSPDVVEFGNTQAQSFEAAGAVVDLSEHREELGGDDLLQSLLEASTYEDSLYAVPYYAGARIMIYNTELFEAAGVDIPTTLG
jgi:ABC-type glycerol-3-phosphate transport system substrate-binding protein